MVNHSMHCPKGKEATYALESTHCFMLLHHMHSELPLVHSLHKALMAHGVRHCLALWLAGGHFNNPLDAGSARYPQNPASLGSPGSHCSEVLVKGDMSSQHQYDTLIFLSPTQGVKEALYCKHTAAPQSDIQDCPPLPLTTTLMICSSFSTKSTFFCVVSEASTALWLRQASLALSYESFAVMIFTQEFPTRCTPGCGAPTDSSGPQRSSYSWFSCCTPMTGAVAPQRQALSGAPLAAVGVGGAAVAVCVLGRQLSWVLFHTHWIPGQAWLQDAGLEKAAQLGDVYMRTSLSSRLLKPPNTYITLKDERGGDVRRLQWKV
ncbi:hypothetical protein F7725_008298, partial [Dissostichus mawsoni]